MPHSMTGFSTAEARVGSFRLVWEIRSVNHRFLELGVRLPEDLRAVEPDCRELVSAAIKRGKVDCTLKVGADERTAVAGAVVAGALEQLKSLEEHVQRVFPQARPLTTQEVLRWPGVLRESALDGEETRARVATLAARAVEELCATRRREGDKLLAALGERLAAMRARLAEVAPLVPEANAAYHARLAEKLRETLGAADEERARAELAVYAVKTDVAEELQRLDTHIAEVERTLAAGGAAGKRLDFLSQELNREANTLASKAATREIADCALELKLLIEQVREQAQNVE